MTTLTIEQAREKMNRKLAAIAEQMKAENWANSRTTLQYYRAMENIRAFENSTRGI